MSPASPGEGLSVLVVDDEPGICKVLTRILEQEGYAVETALSLGDAMTAISGRRFDILLVDKNLPDGNGITIATHVRNERIDSEVVLITGYPSIESAIEAVREGVSDYLRKPIDADDLKLCLKRVIEVRRIKREYRGIDAT